LSIICSWEHASTIPQETGKVTNMSKPTWVEKLAHNA